MNPHRLIRHLLFSCLLCLFCASASAYMVRALPVSLTQPDGSVLDCFASGDEYHNWLHDKDNYTIIEDPESGFYCYAERRGEQLVAGALIAGKDDPSFSLVPGLNLPASEYKKRRATMFPNPEPRDAPTTGTINNLVIFIRFSDETEFGEPLSTYNGWFNSNPSSQKNYYLEASYNQLTVNTHLYPSSGNTQVVSWQDVNHPRAYYKPYSTSNPTGYNGDDQRRDREFTLLQNACAGVGPQIPTNLTIDSDNDGRVDNVVFIIRGAAGAWSSLLWPHRWTLYDRVVNINNKRVYDFNFQLQTFLASRGVGVICHEFFHTLGAPDLYHYTDNGIDPAGSWDLMESDQNPPQHMTAFMKYKYGDWIPSIPVISADQVYSLNPLTAATGQAYRINSNLAGQYYMIEFRKDSGTFESSIPGSGLLIYRIDTGCGNGNADGPPDELYIYRPGGSTGTNGTLSSAHFSQETGRSFINNSSNPSPFLQDGSAGNLVLSGIGSSAGSTMSFRKGAMFIDFSSNPYSQSFDASTFPPEAWLNQAVSGSYSFTRVTSGGNPSCSPQAGAGMLRYNSDVAPSGNSAIMVSPRLLCTDLSSAYAASFWIYRDSNYSSTADKIELYLNSSPNLSGSPQLLGTVHRARQLSPVVSTQGWYKYGFDLPVTLSGDYYVILKAVSAQGYNIFIDSFSLGKVPKAALNPFPAHQSVRVHPELELSWEDGGGGSTGYRLYLGTNNPPSNMINGNNLGNVLQHSLSGPLEPSTLYYWRIVPYNAGGDNQASPVWSFSTKPNTDLSVTGLQIPPYALQGETMELRIEVQNLGIQPAGSYQLQLINAADQTELATLSVLSGLPGAGSEGHNLSWQPAGAGSYSLCGRVIIPGDEYPANDQSSALGFTVFDSDTVEQTVGDLAGNTLSNSLPLNFYWKNSLAETIYLSSELQMAGGELVGLSYYSEFVEDLEDKPVKIWLKNTAETSLEAGWASFTGYSLVFDGTVDFPSGSHTVFIPFASPFLYTGGNLAARVNRPLDSAYFSSSNRFHYSLDTLHPNRSRYLYSDSVVYDPAAPSAGGSLSSNIPLSTFVIDDFLPLALDAPLLSIQTSGGSPVLTWAPVLHALEYHLFATDNPMSWPSQPVAVLQAPGYQIPPGNPRMFYRLKAVTNPRYKKSGR